MDSLVTAAHRHLLRCAESFAAARDAVKRNPEKLAAAEAAQKEAQRAFWAAQDAEEA